MADKFRQGRFLPFRKTMPRGSSTLVIEKLVLLAWVYLARNSRFMGWYSMPEIEIIWWNHHSVPSRWKDDKRWNGCIIQNRSFIKLGLSGSCTLWFQLEDMVLLFEPVLFPMSGVTINWITTQFWSTSRGTFDKTTQHPLHALRCDY